MEISIGTQQRSARRSDHCRRRCNSHLIGSLCQRRNGSNSSESRDQIASPCACVYSEGAYTNSRWFGERKLPKNTEARADSLRAATAATVAATENGNDYWLEKVHLDHYNRTSESERLPFGQNIIVGRSEMATTRRNKKARKAMRKILQ